MPQNPDDSTVVEMVGLTEAEAAAVAEDLGLTVRVVERDGESFPATMDYNPERVNLSIEDGLVTKATLG